MPQFTVRPIDGAITAQVRSTLVAPEYGHPVHRELARGTGPCRECLSAFAVDGEDRLLFTYNAFTGSTHLPQPGPVFIHAEECERHGGTGYPEGLKSIPVIAEAHHRDGTTSASRRLNAGEEGDALTALLGVPTVSFVHLRHAEAGCFIARADRVDD